MTSSSQRYGFSQLPYAFHLRVILTNDSIIIVSLQLLEQFKHLLLQGILSILIGIKTTHLDQKVVVVGRVVEWVLHESVV